MLKRNFHVGNSIQSQSVTNTVYNAHRCVVWKIGTNVLKDPVTSTLCAQHWRWR